MADERTRVVLGTATPGGGFPLYGGAVAEVVNATDGSLAIETHNTKGSTENVPLLEAGDLDIALVQGEVAHEALAGVGRQPAILKIVFAMYSTAGMFVVRADSAYRSIGDLRGKPVVFGARGSGLVILARYVLDGRAAALWGGGTGWPGFTAVAQGPAGARFVAPSADEAKRILAKHAFLKPLTVPAGGYPGQTVPIASVGSWSFILARSTLADDTAYRLARALHRAEGALAARLEQARETTAANTVSAAPQIELIHPGALRYLREIGLVR